MEAINESLAIGVLSLLTDFLKTIALMILLIALSWQLTLVVMLTSKLAQKQSKVYEFKIGLLRPRSHSLEANSFFTIEFPE